MMQSLMVSRTGRILNYSTPNCSTWEQICEHAVRVVTFYDLAGYVAQAR